MRSNCFRIAKALSMRPEDARTSADNAERAKWLDSYESYEISIVLFIVSLRRTFCPSCEDKYILFANAESLYAMTRNLSRSSFEMHIDALISCAYSMALFRFLQCLDELGSNMGRITCFTCEISNARSGLVFANHAESFLMRANLLNPG